jgi:IQ calmodulin-binding motif
LQRLHYKKLKLENASVQKEKIRPSGPKRRKVAAAIKIQCMVRGYLQRLHYQILKLENARMKSEKIKPRGGKKRKVAAAVKIQRVVRGYLQRLHLKSIQRMTQARKEIFLQKMQEREERKKARTDDYLGEWNEKGQQIIAYFRKKNAELRAKNDDLLNAIDIYHEENSRIVKFNESGCDTIGLLQERYRSLHHTHGVVNEIIPHYEIQVQQLQNAIWNCDQHCMLERKIKKMIRSLMIEVMQRVELSMADNGDLVDDVMRHVLEIEAHEAERASRRRRQQQNVGDFNTFYRQQQLQQQQRQQHHQLQQRLDRDACYPAASRSSGAADNRASAETAMNQNPLSVDALHPCFNPSMQNSTIDSARAQKALRLLAAYAVQST